MTVIDGPVTNRWPQTPKAKGGSIHGRASPPEKTHDTRHSGPAEHPFPPAVALPLPPGRSRSTLRSAAPSPEPPLKLTPLVACDRETPMNVLWNIARQAPELRRWIVANPRADAALLEYIAQAGGPGVTEAIETLLDSLESGKHED